MNKFIMFKLARIAGKENEIRGLIDDMEFEIIAIQEKYKDKANEILKKKEV